jgi:hypothetical protein
MAIKKRRKDRFVWAVGGDGWGILDRQKGEFVLMGEHRTHYGCELCRILNVGDRVRAAAERTRAKR